VDQGVHHLQGEAEGVTNVSSEIRHLLRDFYLARLALLMRHEEVAVHVSAYDANNAYQYVINREETHVSWLQQALVDVGAPIPADPARPAVAAPTGAAGWQALAVEDARANQQFVDTWRPKVDAVTHARHQGMLKIVLGEMLEHKRIFDHAAAGRDDLIGTHLAINQRAGVVAPTRWME
jgi:hypothetical protein